MIFQQEGGEEGTAATVATVAPVAAAAAAAAILKTATPKHYIQHSLMQMCNALKDTLGICVPRALPILFDKGRTVNIAMVARTQD